MAVKQTLARVSTRTIVAVGSLANALLARPWMTDYTWHDGKYFVAQVLDPFLLDPGTLAALDAPAYRGTRVGLPLAAQPFRFLGPEGAIVVVSLVAVAFAIWGCARVLERRGVNPSAAAAFGILPPVVLSTRLLLPTTLMLALLIWMIDALDRGSPVALPLAVGAALTRETAVLVVLSIALFLRRWTLAAVPIVVVAGWRLALVALVGGPSNVPGIGIPLRGFGLAVRLSQLMDPLWAVANILGLVAAVLLFVATIARFRDDPDLLTSAAIGGAIIAPLLHEHALLLPHNSLRVLAPGLVFWLISLRVSTRPNPGSP